MGMTNEDKKVAVVTGGSTGFGREVAALLAAAGWTVRIDGRDADAVRRTAAEIGAVGVPGDITEPAHRSDLLRGERLDLLINNASTLGPSPLPELFRYPLDAFRQVVETNLVAPLATIQVALPLLVAGGGAILNVTSDAAVEPYEGWGGYGSSKAALEQLSAVLATENPTVRIWWMDPGDMRTRMHQDAFPGEDISDRPLPATVAPAVLALLRERPPSGRLRASELLVAP
jgi:NAD(P)-dependent dehydrogenase (short-subunit alcohol dehydrogenase family)